MGLNCKKYTGKQKRKIKKMQNEIEKQKKAMKVKKGKK